METFAQQGVVRISGPDARDFLQGQLAPWGSPEGLWARLKKDVVFDQAELEVQPLFYLWAVSPYEEWLSETVPDARGPGDWAQFTLEEGLPHLRGELPQVGGLEALVDLEVLSPVPLGFEGREVGQLKRFGGRLARGVVREEGRFRLIREVRWNGLRL